MHAIILAAGFGTRIAREGCAKAFLNISGRTAIDHIVSRLCSTTSIRTIHIVHNGKWASSFKRWKKDSTFPSNTYLKLHNDGVHDVNARKGAVGDMAVVMEKLDDAEDWVLVPCDTVFFFSVENVIRAARNLDGKIEPTLALQSPNGHPNQGECGRVDLDDRGYVSNFYERQGAASGNMLWIGPAVFPADCMIEVFEYCEENFRKKTVPDRLGDFVSWLRLRRQIKGWVAPQRSAFDIGLPHALEYVRALYRHHGDTTRA